jgi:hypothetical protein
MIIYFIAGSCDFLFYLKLAEIMTAAVIKWSEFMATDPEIRVRFPALPDFFEK